MVGRPIEIRAKLLRSKHLKLLPQAPLARAARVNQKLNFDLNFGLTRIGRKRNSLY
jgi:hypothetical protein